MTDTRSAVRAKRHAKDAHRLWRRHKARAALFATLAAGDHAALAVRRASRKLRQVRGTKS